MSCRALLIGPTGHGGEGVYMDALRRHPPAGVEYDASLDHHRSARGAPCMLLTEVALNQVLHRLAIPDIGFRALRLKARYDLVHAHAHPTFLRGLGETPLVLSEGSSAAAYLGEYLGWSEERLRKMFRRSRRLYSAVGVNDRLLNMARASRVYFFSEWARAINIRWGADPAKLEVIYPGFETPETIDRSQHAAFTFLFVGRDFERKGGYEVVEAFDRVAADLPDVRLVIAGSDLSKPNPDLQIHSWVSPARRALIVERLRALIRAGRIVFHQWVDGERLRSEIYPDADAFLMPSHAEGFGFTNIEAMSFGLPVITSTVGPTEEIVGDGRAGLLVAPGAVEQLTDAMDKCARDRVFARRLGETGRKDFLARFTRERFQAELGDLYRRVLASS